MKVTTDTITDAQIRYLRDNMGWVGERCEKERRMLRAALDGDRVARGLAAGAFNERVRNDPAAAAWNARHGGEL